MKRALALLLLAGAASAAPPIPPSDPLTQEIARDIARAPRRAYSDCTACAAWGEVPNWTMACAGDSITDGQDAPAVPPTGEQDSWCPRLTSPRSGVNIAKGGRDMNAIVNSGATPPDGGAPGLLYAAANPGVVFPADTAYVLAAGGSNDLNDPAFDLNADIMDHLTAAVEALLAAGYRPVIWAPPPRWDTPATSCAAPVEEAVSAANIPALQAALVTMAATYGIPYLDAYTLFKAYGTDIAECTDLYNSDRLHPNQHGQKIIADAVEALIDADWISRCSDPTLCAAGNMGESGNTVVAEVGRCSTYSLPGGSSCEDFYPPATCASAGITGAIADLECQDDWQLIDTIDRSQLRVYFFPLASNDATWTFPGSTPCTGAQNCNVVFSVSFTESIVSAEGTFRFLFQFISTDSTKALELDLEAETDGATGNWRFQRAGPLDTDISVDGVADLDTAFTICLTVTDATDVFTAELDLASGTPCTGALDTMTITSVGYYDRAFNRITLRDCQNRCDDIAFDNLLVCPGSCF